MTSASSEGTAKAAPAPVPAPTPAPAPAPTEELPESLAITASQSLQEIEAEKKRIEQELKKEVES